MYHNEVLYLVPPYTKVIICAEVINNDIVRKQIFYIKLIYQIWLDLILGNMWDLEFLILKYI